MGSCPSRWSGLVQEPGHADGFCFPTDPGPGVLLPAGWRGPGGTLSGQVGIGVAPAGAVLPAQPL